MLLQRQNSSIILSKVDTASINVDLSTIKASVIREESNGSITAKDIARTDNNFIISLSF